MSLDASPRLPQPVADALYAELIDALRELDDEAARRFTARLVLLLVNQVGDPATIREAIRVAAEAGPAEGGPDGGRVG